MFENILIGQYIEASSPIHRLSAVTKLIMTVIFAAAVFAADKPAPMLIAIVMTLAVIRLAGLELSLVLKSTKYIIFLAFFTFIFNAVFTEGERIFGFGALNVTKEGVLIGALCAVRLVILVWSAAVLTLTTRPLDMTDAVEDLLSPLSKFSVPVSDIAVMMGLTLRFVPTLGLEAQRISDAQKSRCADFGGGSVVKKAKAALPLIIPLLAGAFRHSDALAEAMDARCYGSNKRTRMRNKKPRKIDLYASIIFGAVTAVLIGVELI